MILQSGQKLTSKMIEHANTDNIWNCGWVTNFVKFCHFASLAYQNSLEDLHQPRYQFLMKIKNNRDAIAKKTENSQILKVGGLSNLLLPTIM